MTRSFALVGEEFERQQAFRDDAQAELDKCLKRAEELHRYIAHLTEEMGELVSDRGALLARRRTSNTETKPSLGSGF